MKKLIVGVLAALCAVCLSIAVACKKDEEPKYYTLTFEKVDGITYDCEIPNGYEVREGETVTFSVSLADNVVGEPTVTANDSKLTADEGGKYSFKMNSDTTVSVSDTFILNRYLVTFKTTDPDGDEYRLTYNCKDGDVDEGFTVSAGDKISFTVDMSVYYDTSNMKVLANTQILQPDADGVYTYTVNGKTNISITDVTLAQWFGEKDNGGSGTKEDPYIISEPIDLYEMSAFVKDPFSYNLFFTAYYKMEKDIDLKGEQLFIIGDSEQYPFAGHFDGNGHTISNFYIEDVLIDQETFVPYHTSYVGMFGCVSATPQDEGMAEIYNLKLDNYTITVNAAKDGNAFSAGSIVGWGVGVNITGCSATNGTILADADDNYFGYIGGIIGTQNSVYQSESVSFTSIVSACSSSVEILGLSGYVNAAGGIAGVVTSTEPHTTASIINCYSTGNVSGAMSAGGIVGRLEPYGSVQGCYSTGFIEARNTINLMTGNEQFAYAYAGGIAGYVYYDAIVCDSFSTSGTYAYAVADASGKYSFTGKIAAGVNAGGAEDKTVSIEANPALILNCYSENITKELILNQLKWHAQDWTFVEGSDLPVINMSADGQKQFILKINLGDEKFEASSDINVEINSVYSPMAIWYTRTDGCTDINGFINADSGNRSYGIYFDAAHTQKVPNGYIPINDVTLYAGFADYSEVAGDYYFTGANGSYLTLDNKGGLKYVDGALTHTSYYSYDGTTITLYDTFIGVAFDNAQAYLPFKATLNNGILSVYDNGDHPANSAIRAVKASGDFNYGTYWAADGSEYTFNKNGTGTAKTLAQTVNFTYEITASGLTVKAGTETVTCTVDANGNVTKYGSTDVYAYDNFKGVWEKSAGSKKQYVFDGKGNYTVTGFGYDKDGNKVGTTSNSGTYTVNSDGEMEIGSYTVGINQDGFIVIGGETYYKENSFVGVWNFFNNTDPVELTLNGIGVNGIGTALIDYGAYGSFNITYAASGDSSITLYSNDMPLGTLSYNAGANTLTGRLYLARLGNVNENVTFFLYDDFRGSWVGDNVLELVEFNGLGNYQVAGNVNHMAVSGSVTVNGVEAGAYTLVNSTLTGSFEYDGVTYNISYENGVIKVNGTIDLIKHDDMYGLQLKDGDGLIYSFDGRGNLTSGGTLTVSDGTTETTYTYTNGASVINISGGATGTITIGTDYVLNLGGTKTLTVVNGFTGTWLVAGTDGTLVVGEINAQMKAQGSAFGDSVEFTYHRDGNYLTYTDNNQTYYIDVMQAGGVTELIVSMQHGNASQYSVCVAPDSLDGYQGTYNAADTGNYLTLDGFGSAKFVSGTAELYANGEKVETYTYTIGTFGMEFSKGTKKYLFVECLSTDSGAYGKDGAYRKLVECDALFGYTAYLASLNEDGKLVTDKSVSFTFNGIGKLTCSNGTTYSYTINLRDRASLQYVLTLDNNGTISRAVLNYGGENITLELGACDVAPLGTFTDAKNVSYMFDGLSNLSVGGTFYVTADNATTSYVYRVADGTITIYNSNNTVYGVLVSENGSYKIVLANNGGVISLTAEE